ncbi:hypothetical protein AGOR_G00048370 [Albula goreensis]|uniref:G-protein coupled receptors family 1 profile domain-containing protein n=1 Tax=Albula goreensis TaxID=1534307 RepID=A0A8T3DTI6_9TELE|nr:hypothetical protein AGOR_G00048370 [Albula goreensis]
MGLGQVKKQYPQTWCFIDWRSNDTTHAAFSYMYAGFSSFLILSTIICNILVCGALIRMHKRFMRRTSLGTDQRRIADLRRRRSFGRMAGAEIQMVILLIATSAVILICSIPLVVQVFVNQLYRTPVEERIERNPDLKAIRIASVNPILDPWIYILLRKTVLLKLVEKIKCLFCKIGGRTVQRSDNFHFANSQQCSSVASNDSPYITSWELREVTTSSQTYLYLPEKKEGLTEGHNPGQVDSGPSGGRSLKGLRGSNSFNEQDSDRTTSDGQRVSVSPSNLSESFSFPKDQTLHVTFTDEALNLQEKCI